MSSDPAAAPWHAFAPPQATTADELARELAVIRGLLDLSGSEPIRFEDEGWDSRVYVVGDGAAVFKFPRSPLIRAGYASEIAVLQAVAALGLPVWTPTVAWVGPDLEYFGYEGLPGSAPVLDDLAPAERERLGTAIGRFVRVLHDVSLPEVRVVTVADEIRDVATKADAAAPILDRHFPGRERADVDALFGRTVPEALERLGAELVTCHGDLGPWNVILGRDGRIGIIDFGDVRRTDRSRDLCGLGNAAALDAALAAYGRDDPTLREKIAVRTHAGLLMDLLFFTGKRDATGLGVCLERARRAIAGR